MDAKHDSAGLRIAAVFSRRDSLATDLWLHALRYLTRLPNCVTARFDPDFPIASFRQWHPSGLLLHCSGSGLHKTLAPLGLPSVNTSGFHRELPIPTVTPDNVAVGVMAAQFLLGKGYRSFGYVGFGDRQFSRDRFEGFRSTVEAQGRSIQVYDDAVPSFASPDMDESPKHTAFYSWINALPVGSAIFTADDSLAFLITEQLRLLNLPVPGRFAVLAGHDRNTPANPPLSAVRMPEERWGYEAARMLVDIIRGKPFSKHGLRLPPLGVVERASTMGMATDDPVVRKAAMFIQDHATQPISVTDVTKAVALGRRALERRFARALDRSILQEIHRAHLEHAKALLIDTELSVHAVATESGLTDEKHLRRLFTTYHSTTPGAFRRQHRIT